MTTAVHSLAVSPESVPRLLRHSWRDLPAINLSNQHLRRNRIVSVDRSHPSHVAVDMLRTRLMGTHGGNRCDTLAITSPRGGCGKTTLALNLAFSFAQQTNFRVALLDLDLRRPSVARLLGHDRPCDLKSFLRGHRSMAESLLRHDESLVFALNTQRVASAAELLMECIPGTAVPMMREGLDLDLIILDLPPMLAADDVLAILPSVDRVLLVAAAGETTMSEIDICERDLSQHGKLAGTVLNKCRYLPDRYGY